MKDMPQDINENPVDAPLATFIGRKVVRMADGKSEVDFTMPEVFLNMQNILHGGAYATMLDTACGVAIRSSLDMEKYAGQVTLELKTNYLKAGEAGAYKAFGEALRVGKSIAFSEATLYNCDGELVATASATFRLRLRK